MTPPSRQEKDSSKYITHSTVHSGRFDVREAEEQFRRVLNLQRTRGTHVQYSTPIFFKETYNHRREESMFRR